jgi:hypothetical protein
MCISLKMSVSEVKDMGYTNFGHPWKHKQQERTRQSLLNTGLITSANVCQCLTQLHPSDLCESDML